MLPVKTQNDEARAQNCYLTNIITSNNNNIEQQQLITALFEITKQNKPKKNKYNPSTVDM